MATGRNQKRGSLRPTAHRRGGDGQKLVLQGPRLGVHVHVRVDQLARGAAGSVSVPGEPHVALVHAPDVLAQVLKLDHADVAEGAAVGADAVVAVDVVLEVAEREELARAPGAVVDLVALAQDPVDVEQVLAHAPAGGYHLAAVLARLCYPFG